jgi:glucosamine--fructose-6-phosphate aminotransferase (isomerizing)
MLFLGRGALFPIALEGALKLKEISYIHAEGYAAGEMKHGPIALIDEHVPSVILNPRDAHFAKVRSNLAEIRARSGPVILVAEDGDQEAQEVSDLVLRIPAGCPNHLLALVMSVPMQLLAYFTADYKGTDVDQPRNLAKSVTVE